MITYRYATRDDIIELVPRLRPEDTRELQALSFDPPEDTLLRSWEISHPVYIMEIAGEGAVAVFGAVVQKDLGIPWMVGTDAIDRHKIVFGRQTQRIIEMVSHGVDVLANYVDVRNKNHIEWLQWAGFKFGHKRSDIAVDGTEFQLFWRYS